MKHRNKGHLGKFYSRGTINLAVLITSDRGDNHKISLPSALGTEVLLG